MNSPTRFRVTNITWVADGDAPELPAEAWVECGSRQNIAHTLSDTFDWLVIDFEVAEPKEGA